MSRDSDSPIVATAFEPRPPTKKISVSARTLSIDITRIIGMPTKGTAGLGDERLQFAKEEMSIWNRNLRLLSRKGATPRSNAGRGPLVTALGASEAALR